MNIFAKISKFFKRLSPYDRGLFISAIFFPAVMTVIGIFALIFCGDFFLLASAPPALVLVIAMFYTSVCDND